MLFFSVCVRKGQYVNIIGIVTPLNKCYHKKRPACLMITVTY